MINEFYSINKSTRVFLHHTRTQVFTVKNSSFLIYCNGNLRMTFLRPNMAT